MNDQKQNVMIALIIFCITVVVCQFVLNRPPAGELSYGGIGGRMMTSLLVGVGVGGVAWGILAVVNR